ncbi:MAG: phosphatase [Olegusella sp.]|nr:phosphatase [Olegusella sp.]
MGKDATRRYAVIDIGTVTARLAVSEAVDGHVRLVRKISTICNLGQGVDRTRMLDPEACERVRSCVAGYVATARELGVAVSVCTLTSAARDASNSTDLLAMLRAAGVEPQVIPGEVEGRLTFLGVAQDFAGKQILVADNGGGSTELACGRLVVAGADAAGTGVDAADVPGLHMDLVVSTDVGCRRLTDRFLSRTDPPAATDRAEAHAFAASLFGPVIAELRDLGATPEVLAVTGGTATTLVAISKKLVPYDSAQVHLAQLTRARVAGLEDLLGGLTVEQRAAVPGIQAKRAPVILAGTVALGELMDRTGFGAMTVSESDLLVGMTLTLDAAVRGVETPVGWTPVFASL